MSSFGGLGIPSSQNRLWAQQAEQAKPVCRSLDELLHWRHQPYAPEVEFDFEAYLVLAGKNWDTVSVEYLGKSLVIEVTQEMSNQLIKNRAGTRMRFSGSGEVDPEDWNVVRLRITKFDPDLADEPLEPVPAKMAPGTKGTPLWRFAYGEGQIREIVTFHNRVQILATEDGYDFEVVQYGDNPQLRAQHLRQRWAFSGLLRRSQSVGAGRPLHELALMHADQMEPVDSPPSSSSSPPVFSPDTNQQKGQREAFEGMVAFSDRESNVGVVSGDQRFWVKTNLAHHLPAGTTIRGVGRPMQGSKLDVASFRAEFIRVFHSPRLVAQPPTRVASIEDLFAMPHLPPRVRLSATVKYCVFKESTMELYLKTTQGEAIARIPLRQRSPGSPRDFFTEGTQLECLGMPIRQSFQSGKQEQSAQAEPDGFRLLVYVASAEDITVLNRPLTVPTNRLIAGGGFLFVALACGSLWIARLRRRVKAGDRSLTEFDQHFQTAFGAMQCGVLIVDQESRILRSNHHLESFFGVEPTLNSRLEHYLPCMDLAIEPPSCMSDLADASRRSSGRVLSAELPMRGLRRTTRVFSCPIDLDHKSGQSRLWLFEDISEKRQLESDLLQSQKMDAVGRLSGGVAHDFNNLLLIIQSSLEMIRSDVSIRDGSRGHDGMQSAELAVQRAKELTQQLLGFARQQQMEKKRVNAIALIQDVEALASRVIEPGQGFSVETQCERVMVEVDPGRIEQALLNLCINAIDVTKHDGGRVSLTVSKLNDPTYGPSAQFTILDNGPGISREDQVNIFDPFFTTKPIGQGTGLGLSIALGIIEQHGGRIDFQSTPERGTRFDVILPAISDHDATLGDLRRGDLGHCDLGHGDLGHGDLGHGDLRHGDTRLGDVRLLDRQRQHPRLIHMDSQETTAGRRVESRSALTSLSVLVVEDEPDVRRASCEMLETLGHQVESVENAMLAIRKIASGAPDLVLLDLMLPEMTGIEAYHEIRSAWPDLLILFCSGRSDAETLIREACQPDTPAFLAKPFSIEQLKDALNSVMAMQTGDPACPR